MPELTTRRVRHPALLLASGGTAVFAALFLAIAVASLAVRNGIFGAGIGVMLACYGLILAVMAWFAVKGRRWAVGGMVASSLLHLLVSVSTARGSHQPWLWLVAALAVVTLVAALRVHLADLKDRTHP